MKAHAGNKIVVAAASKELVKEAELVADYSRLGLPPLHPYAAHPAPPPERSTTRAGDQESGPGINLSHKDTT